MKYHPFTLEGNFASAEGIQEKMLTQSHIGDWTVTWKTEGEILGIEFSKSGKLVLSGEVLWTAKKYKLPLRQ